MIVVSVVLILVAVTLLVLGVAGGSSTLLISSIVASLLAAIALVAGARRAATMRRAVAPVPEPLEADIKAGPGPDLPVAVPVGPAPGDAPSAAGTRPGAWNPSRRRGGRRRRDQATPEPSFADNPPAPDEALASPTDTKARVANRDDAEAALAADAAYHAAQTGAARIDQRATDPGRAYAQPTDADPHFAAATDADPHYAAAPDADPHYAAAPDADPHFAAPDADPHFAAPPDADPHFAPARDADPRSAAADADLDVAAANDAGTTDDPDYRRASSVIDAARTGTPNEHTWRRPTDQRGAEDESSGLAEEFAEPDAEDPDDEPLPQAVRPADAVRVARMPAEVLVVDGRPRYHMADCPHLVGRLTEALPAAEAVELGFSPCGLCRPVDRLMARAAQR